MPSGEPLRRIVTGSNAAVVEAGNDILLELVVRKENPGASLVLVDLFDRLGTVAIAVVCLRCAKQVAMERDHASIDEDGCDLIIDSGSTTLGEEVAMVRDAQDAGGSGGIDRLRARARREARETGWNR